jgi:hypothetical protein
VPVGDTQVKHLCQWRSAQDCTAVGGVVGGRLAGGRGSCVRVAVGRARTGGAVPAACLPETAKTAAACVQRGRSTATNQRPTASARELRVGRRERVFLVAGDTRTRVTVSCWSFFREPWTILPGTRLDYSCGLA